MGYALGMSACYGCKRIFCYNPNRVPTIPINGSREPVCRTCIERANPERIKRGLEPIVPLPDAYEPLDEDELW